MKKRRSTIVAVLLVLALALGIGYASLSRELVIGSEANLAPDENDFDIVFTDASINDAKWGTASVTGAGKGGHYTLTGLSAKGDQAVMTFIITNRTPDVDATLVSVSTEAGTLYLGEGTSTSGNPADYFDKQVVITMGEQTYEAGESFVVPANGTATVTVTVTLKQTVVETVTLSGASVYLSFQGN